MGGNTYSETELRSCKKLLGSEREAFYLALNHFSKPFAESRVGRASALRMILICSGGLRREK
jgi:hypothetical protein